MCGLAVSGKGGENSLGDHNFWGYPIPWEPQLCAFRRSWIYDLWLPETERLWSRLLQLGEDFSALMPVAKPEQAA